MVQAKKKEMQGWWEKVGHAWGPGIAYQGKNAEALSENSIRWGWKGRVGFGNLELINSDKSPLGNWGKAFGRLEVALVWISSLEVLNREWNQINHRVSERLERSGGTNYSLKKLDTKEKEKEFIAGGGGERSEHIYMRREELAE